MLLIGLFPKAVGSIIRTVVDGVLKKLYRTTLIFTACAAPRLEAGPQGSML
jgi:hypothetical protein